ncbi:MAG: heme lyase NrfEFG subunit NrfE, partial [Magnetococcales bacterium]|nr:heme lyase NrfEFG subunit NrfE [Magnetococcales bacterium]
NWKGQEAVMEVTGIKNNKKRIMRPQKRVYNNHSMPMTEAAIYSQFLEDIYVVLGDPVTETTWAFRLYRNPLVSWIWAGSEMMALGILFSLLQGRRQKPKNKGESSYTI